MIKDLQVSRAGYVYLVWAVATPRYKIGKSIDPDRRLEELNEQSCYPLILLEKHYFNDMTLHEKRIQSLLGEYRVHGEWFELPSWILEYTNDWLHDETCSKIKRNFQSQTLIYKQTLEKPIVSTRERSLIFNGAVPFKVPPTRSGIERAVMLLGNIAKGQRLKEDAKRQLRLLIGCIPNEKEAKLWKQILKDAK